MSNRDAIGARIELRSFSGDTLASREIQAGNGYGSTAEPVVHFGGMDAKVLYQVDIQFPGGRSVNQVVSAGNQYQFSEITGISRWGLLNLAEFRRTIAREELALDLLLFAVLGLMIWGFITLALRRYNWRNDRTLLLIFGVMALPYLLSLFIRLDRTWLIMVQIATMVLLLPLSIGFLETIRRLEQRRSGDRQLLKDLSDQLILIKSNTELYQVITQRVRTAYDCQFCVFFQREGDGFQLKSQAGSKVISQNNISERYFSEIKKAILDFQPDTAPIALDCFVDTPIYLLQGVFREGELFGFLMLGKSRYQTQYRPEDKELMQILSRQMRIAIDNNRYISETRDMAQQLAASELREQYTQELETQHQQLQELYQTLQDTQLQLIQSEKMGSLGQLVAGIAHELNNPISFIYANMKELDRYILAVREVLDIASQTPEDVEEKIEELNQIHDIDFIREDIPQLIRESMDGSQRVKDLVQNLRNFSRLDEAEFKRANVLDGLDTTLKLLNNEFKNRIVVHKDYQDIPPIMCHPGQLNQVFMNILINASQAIEGKGNIWIQTRLKDKSALIDIRDDGKGISPELLGKIFDPFFTTKPVGEGTGLGLSISYQIIEKHQGKLTAESELGKGTTIRIQLPLNQKR